MSGRYGMARGCHRKTLFMEQPTFNSQGARPELTIDSLKDAAAAEHQNIDMGGESKRFNKSPGITPPYSNLS